MGQRTLPAAGSVWMNFDASHMAVMRSDARANHPARFFTYRLIQQEFGRRHFEWLDVGTVGMVDYERLVGQLHFTFTGADLSPAILDDSRRYLKQEHDRLVCWNIEEPPEAAGLTPDQFDLITVRHVLNHCRYYDQPLLHIYRLLKEGGLGILTLHLRLREEPDRLHTHAGWSVPGEVIGNYYNREKFLRYLTQWFRIERFVRVDDGRKPNDVLLVRKSQRRDAGGGAADDGGRAAEVFVEGRGRSASASLGQDHRQAVVGMALSELRMPLALRLDDVGASSKRDEVYSDWSWGVGPLRLSGNWLWLKYLPPFKKWGPYRELTAAEWQAIYGVLDACGAKLTVAVTAAWVETADRLVPFPQRFPEEAAALKAGVRRGMIEIANHGLTHCVLAGQAFRPRWFSSNRRAHREFWEWVPPDVHDRHLARAQTILQDYFEVPVVTLVPPGNVFTDATLKAAAAHGLRYVSCEAAPGERHGVVILGDDHVLAMHDRDIVMHGVEWLRAKLGAYSDRAFCTVAELAQRRQPVSV